MYFAVVKLNFEAAPKQGQDRKALRSLTEKLRSRFKVCAAVCSEEEEEGVSAIAVTALASSEEKLTQMLDAISSYCEESGFGRIESEDALLDHIDSLQDYASSAP